MSEKETLAALSQAVRDNRLTLDQLPAILRELEQTPGASLPELIASHGGPSLPLLSGDPGATIDQDSGVLPAAAAGTADATDAVDAQLRYQPTGEIGRGGLGRVVQAHDLHVGRDVAIKELLPGKAHSTDRIERFFFEARLTGQLEHPAIVPVHAVGLSPEGLPFYAMKLVQGRTLADLIHDYHALNEADPARADALRQLFRSLIEVCHAVAFAHSRGVIHRDIKPRNIMVGDFGEVLLVDWGLAKQTRPEQLDLVSAKTAGSAIPLSATPASLSALSDRQYAETRDGSVLGTVGYMSPEQARGDLQHVDQRTDIFALGATLYEILVGRPPYVGAQALAQARQGAFPAPRALQPQTPPAIQAICLRALAADPRARYQSAQELADEIGRYQAGDPVQAYPEPWPVRAGRWLRRHRTACTSTAAACVVLAAATIAWKVHLSQQVRELAEQARGALREVQPALADNQLPLANLQLRHAEDLLGKPSWLSPAAELEPFLIQARAQIDAYVKYETFCNNYEQAVYQGLFTGGEEDTHQAIEAVREALHAFKLPPDADRDPQFPPAHYTTQQVRQIESACQQLRWVYADLQARAGRTVAEHRAGARKADALLNSMRPAHRQFRAFHLRRAWYLSLAGDEAAAAGEMREAQNVAPVDADDYFLVGDMYYRQGDYAAAVEQFQQALQVTAGHLWAQYELGIAQTRLERWHEALTNLTAVTARRPDFINLYLVRGLVYGELENLAAALRDFKTAEEKLGSKDYGLLINRGGARLRAAQREIKKAEERLCSNDYDLLITGEAMQATRKNFALAEEDFRQAARAVPAATAAYLNLAELHQTQKQYQLARQELDRAIALAPDHPGYHQRRSRIHAKLKDDPQALADLRRALDLAPARSPLWVELNVEQGLILHRQEKLREAVAAYDRALDVQSDLPEANRLSGLALVNLEQYRDGVRRLDKYLAYAECHTASWATAGQSEAKEARRLLAGAYRERGLAHRYLDNHSAAVADFVRAMQLAPPAVEVPFDVDRHNMVFMLGRLGWNYLLQGPDLALPVFDAAIQADGKNANLYAGRAYAQSLRQEYTQAVADIDHALELEPRNPGLLFNAAGVFSQAYAGLKRQGKTAEARPYLDRALDLLRQGWDRSPAAERKAYLKNVAADPALDPLRDNAKFQQFATPSAQP